MRTTFLRSFFILGVGLLPALVRGQAAPHEGVTQAPPATWIGVTEVDTSGTWEPQPSGRDYLLLDTQIHAGRGERYFHSAFRVVSEEGRRDGAQVSIDFDPTFQQLRLHRLRVRRGRDTIDKLDLSRLQVLQQERDLDRQLYDGQRSALMILDDVRVGDVIELGYTLEGRNPVFDGRFIDTAGLGWGVPVRDLRCRMVAPRNRTVSHRLRGAPEGSDEEVLVDDHREWRWRATHLTVIEAEDRIPDWYITYPFVEFSEFGSWAEVVDWARPLYSLEGEAGRELKEVAAEIAASAATPGEKAVAALRFVQDEVRYLGIMMGAGTHRPSLPDEVLRRRFGDCKDKARLLVALLRELGIASSPALVHSSRRHTVRDWLPSPYAFDHVIVAVEIDGRRHLVDPTLSYQRGDTLALRHVGHYGPYLRIDAGATDLEQAELGEHDRGGTVVREEFTIHGFEAPSDMKVVSTYRGSNADGMRSYFATRSREQIGRDYLEFYTPYFKGISSAGRIELSDDPARNEIEVTERYTIERIFAAQPNSAVLAAEFSPAVVISYVRVPNLGQRKSPLALGYPSTIRYEAVINLPEDWPESDVRERIEDDAFLYTSRVLSKATRMELNYEWTTRAAEVSPNRLTDFGRKIDRVLTDLGQTLTYDPELVASAGNFPVNVPMASLAALALFGCGVGARTLVRKRNPVPEPPPLPVLRSDDPYAPASPEKLVGLGGWLILVGIGLVVRPILIVVTLSESLPAYFNQAVWDVVTTPGTEHYEPHYAWLAPTELVLNVLLLAMSLTALVLYFRRSHVFPPLMQALFLVIILVSIYDVSAGQLMTATEEADRAESLRALVQVCIQAAVWIPYLRVSRRVKLTFTH